VLVITPFIYNIHDEITLPNSITQHIKEFTKNYNPNQINLQKLCPIRKNQKYLENITFYNECKNFAIEKLFPIYNNLYDITPNKHYKELIRLKEAIFIPSIGCVPPNIHHPIIHTDAYWKAMSTIYYISEYGTGTPLYDNQQNFITEIEWKQGRGYSFIPCKTSYHTYGNKTNYNRLTLVINLTTKKLYRRYT
jgi:hypothetical protein